MPLAENTLDRGIVAHEQRVPRRAHLEPEGVLDLAGGVHPLAGLIEEPAVAGHGGNGLEAHGAYGDEENGHEKKRREQLGMDRRAQPRHPSHQRPKGPVAEKQTRDPLGQARVRFRGRNGGLGGILVIVCAHSPSASSAARHASREALAGQCAGLALIP